MRTVITEKVDDYQVIVGYDRLAMDPVATRNKVNKILDEDGTIDQLAKKSEEIREKNAKLAKFPKLLNKSKNEKLYFQFTSLQLEIYELCKKYADFLIEVEAKRKQLMKDYAIFFEPKFGEYAINDDDFARLSAATSSVGENEKACLFVENGQFDAKIVPDFRGYKFFKKEKGRWTCSICTSLGQEISNDFRPLEYLSEVEKREIADQVDRDRISKLPLYKREQERDMKIDQYLRLAAIKRSELEILNDSLALQKSRDFFEEKKNEMTERYK